MTSAPVRENLKKMIARCGFRVVRTSSLEFHRYPPDYEAGDIAIMEAVAPYTMTSVERLHALIKAVEYVVAAQVPGDIVECGVWKGGSMMAVAKALMRCQDLSRTLHLFDTYEGMPAPAECDREWSGESAAQLLARSKRSRRSVWALASLAEVRRNMESTGYPSSRIAYVKGRVEETLEAATPARISLLRLDTDWYESTRCELDHLFPRLSDSGILIVDDYGHWAGARKAVDEYFAAHEIRLFLSRIDYTGRIGVKQR